MVHNGDVVVNALRSEHSPSIGLFGEWIIRGFLVGLRKLEVYPSRS